MIDDQPNHYTVEQLQEMKSAHEQFVSSSLDTDSKRSLRDRETVAGYIDHWVEVSDLDEWNVWTSWLFSSQSTITKERRDALESLSTWLLSRIWPREGFSGIEIAMNNFRRVVGGFLNTFSRYCEPFPDREEIRGYRIRKLYDIDEWNEDLHLKLLRKYEAYNVLIDDYALELTRAANHVCDCIRDELLHSFRIKEGYLLATSDMDMSLRYTTYRPRYLSSDFPSLFEGEEDFNLKRLHRDVCLGTTEDAQFFDAEYKQRREIFKQV